MDNDRPAVSELMAAVSAALTPRITEVSGEVFEVIVREIPQLRADKSVRTLLASSIDSNVTTCLHVLRHGMDLANGRAHVAAEEYARRLAQRRHATSHPAAHLPRRACPLPRLVPERTGGTDE